MTRLAPSGGKGLALEASAAKLPDPDAQHAARVRAEIAKSRVLTRERVA